jgi:Protein of unknown function (DUF3592)
MIWMLLEAGVPYYLCGVGALCIVGGLWLFWRRLAILPRALRTTGTIMRWERQRDSEFPNTFHYFPHVRFVDGLGREHDMRIDIGYSSEKYPIGHPYAIRYDPKDPRRAYAANLLMMLIGPLMLAVLGAVGLAGGIKAFLLP